MPYAPTTPGTKTRIIAKRANAEIANLARELAHEQAAGREPMTLRQFLDQVENIDRAAQAAAARYRRQ